MIDQFNDFFNRRIQVFISPGFYRLPYEVQCFQARIFVSGSGRQARYSSDVVVRGVSSAFRRLLKGFQSPQYFCLHDQHGFQHFLCVIFSHVVFLILVNGVAAITLAGGDVAFYLWGAL